MAFDQALLPVMICEIRFTKPKTVEIKAFKEIKYK